MYLDCVIRLKHVTVHMFPICTQQIKAHVNEVCVMVRRNCRYEAIGCKFEVSGLTALQCL